MRPFLLIAAGALVTLTNGFAAPALKSWDAAADLAKTELPDGNPNEAANPNGLVPEWSYGYRSKVSGTKLTLFTGEEHENEVTSATEIAGGWAVKGTYPYVHIPFSVSEQSGTQAADALAVHPGATDTGMGYVVVRWTAPAFSRYKVDASWVQQDPAVSIDGVDVHLVQNGESIFDAALLAGGSTSKSTTLYCEAGETLDFVVGPNGTRRHDLTQLSVQITQIKTVYIEKVFQTGELVGEAIPDARIAGFRSPATNTAGDVVVKILLEHGSASVSTSNDAAIILDGTAGRTLIARKGFLAPGFTDHWFSDFEPPVINARGDVAFIGILNSTEFKDDGVWWFHNGTLRLVAWNRTPAFGTGSREYGNFVQVALPDVGGPVFVGKIRDQLDFGLWQCDEEGNLTLIARTGAKFPMRDPNGKVVESILALDGFGQTRSLATTGEITFRLTYTDGTSEIVRYVGN